MRLLPLGQMLQLSSLRGMKLSCLRRYCDRDCNRLCALPTGWYEGYYQRGRGGEVMFARHLFRAALIALLLLVCATPRPAKADAQQYVVVYVELLPGSESSGERVLDQLAAGRSCRRGGPV